MEGKKIISCLGWEAGLFLFYIFFWKIGIKPLIPEQDMVIVRNVFLILVILSLFLLFLLEVCRWKKSRREIRFFLMLFIFGLMYQLVLPAFSAPDEDTHFTSAYRLSNQMMFQKDTDDEGYTRMRKEDSKGQVYTFGEKEFTAHYRKLFLPAKEGKTVSYTRRKSEQTVPFVVYLAPACGITIARLLHWNGKWTAFLGRICCLILFALLAVVSYRLLPFAHQSVVVLCTMPMTVSLFSSFSYDGINLALILLFFSLLMNCVFVREKVTWKEIAVLGITAVCFVPIKMVYFPFLWLVFLIPLCKFKNKIIGWLTYAALNLLPLMESFLLKSSKISFIAAGTTNLTANDGYTFLYVLQHPLKVIKFISFSVFFKNGDEIIEGFAGRSLGWLDTKIPRYLAYSFLFLLLLEILSEECRVFFVKWQKILVAAAVLVSVGLPVLIMFLAETERSDSILACVQGRYFIPVVLFFLILFQNKKFVQQKKEDDMQLERLLVYLNSLSVIMVLHSVMGR